MKDRKKRLVSNSHHVFYAVAVGTSVVIMVVALIFLAENEELTQTKNEIGSTEVEYKAWKDANHLNYSFVLHSSCHNAHNTLVEVRDGKVVYPTEPNHTYPSIEQLFELIEEGKTEADYYTAFYHQLGFPQYVNILWDLNAYDRGCGFDVADFRILDGIGPIPSVNHKKRIKEKRFVPPGMPVLEHYENKLWTKEEREAWAKMHIYPGSQVEFNFEQPTQKRL